MKLLRRARVFLRAHRNGQSLIEILVAMAVGVVLLLAAAAAIAPALRANNQSINAQTAGLLSKELSDNVRAWSQGSWNSVLALATTSANTYYLNTSVSPFTAVSGQETITSGSSTFTRYFYVSDIYRDSSGNATSTASGNSYDPSTKQITIVSGPATLGPNIQSWPMTATLAQPLGEPGAVAYNGYLYSIGGVWTNGLGTSTVSYAPINSNGTLGSWTNTAALPHQNALFGTGINNGYLYSIGGIENGGTGFTTSTVLYANVNSNGTLGSWSQTTALPFKNEQFGSVFYNGYAYSIGGLPGGSGTTTVLYAPFNSNGTVGSWTATTPLPYHLYADPAVAYNGFIYTVGGADSGGTSTSTVNYAKINSDGTIGVWSATTALPHAIQNNGAVVINGYLYSVGGSYPGVNGLTVIYFAQINSNGTVGSWSTATAPLTVPQCYTSAYAYNGNIYTIGGNPGCLDSTNSSTVTYSSFAPSIIFGNAAQQTTSFYLTRNANNAFLQNNWVSGPNQNGPVIGATSGFSTSTNIDYSSNPGSICLPLAPKWQATTPLPGTTLQDGIALNNGYIYQLASSNGTYYAQPNATGSISNWSSTTAMSLGSLGSYSSVANNGYLYLLGGIDGPSGIPTSTVNFAPINSTGSIGTITRTTKVPNNLADGSAAVYNGYIYLLGGSASDTVATATSTVWYAQPNSTGSISNWSSTTALPNNSINDAAAVYNGRLYQLVGGVATYYTQPNANGSISNWSSTTIFPSGGYDYGLFANNGYVYVTGGYDSFNNPTSTVYFASINSNGTLGTWSTTASLPYATDKHKSVANNGYFYSMGGDDPNGNLTSTVNYFSTATSVCN